MQNAKAYNLIRKLELIWKSQFQRQRVFLSFFFEFLQLSVDTKDGWEEQGQNMHLYLKMDWQITPKSPINRLGNYYKLIGFVVYRKKRGWKLVLDMLRLWSDTKKKPHGDGAQHAGPMCFQLAALAHTL